MGIQSSADKVEHNDNLLSTLSSPSNIQIEHLETFFLLWLDEKRIDDQNQQLKKRLRQLTTNFIYFDDVRLCEQWVNSRPIDEKILFIVSGRVGPKIVPFIHNLTSIIGIYIFSMILENTSGWIQPYSKIRATVFTPEELIQQISKDQRYFENIEDSKVIQIFKAPSRTRILDREYASIIWYLLFLEILLSPAYLPSSPSPKKLIDFLRRSISNDKESSNLINEFELTYHKQNPMKWLINNTPIGRFLRKALREQNIELLFYLRFFLIDIYNYFVSNQSTPINVYRKQPMSIENIENIRSNVNNHLMINDFLSTSIKSFDTSIIDRNENGYETVFIEIDTQQHDGTLPFARFQNSIDTGENDPSVVFMCGSIFKIISFESNPNSNCRLKLSLVGSKELNILNEIQIKLRKTNDSLMVVGFLDKSNQSDKTNTYCQQLLRQLPSNHRLISSIYDHINMNRRIEPISLVCTKFILIGLTKDNLSPFAFAFMKVLQSLTNDSILIVQDFSEVAALDKRQYKEIYIFTNCQIHPSEEDRARSNLFIFILEEKKNPSNQSQHYNNSEDLIWELYNELCKCYTSEIKEDTRSGKHSQAEQKEELINEINKQSKEVQRMFSSNDQSLTHTETTIIWLKFNDQNNKIIENTQKLFENIVSSFLILDDCNECFNYVCTDGVDHSIYLIIDDNYKEGSIGILQTLENIKQIYRFNQSGIRLRLIYDLVLHFYQLANHHEPDNKINDKKKNMLSKVYALCELIPRL